MSIRQPHAEAIMRGVKMVESRSRRTKVRGRIYNRQGLAEEAASDLRRGGPEPLGIDRPRELNVSDLENQPVARKKRKSVPPRKMSEIMKEMLERLLRDPQAVPSDEASHVALFLANVAWNECVGVDAQRDACHAVWQQIEAENPDLWDELKSRDIDGMIDELVEYKKAHYPDDRRRILLCGGTPHGTIRVEWLPPAAPGVDSESEMQLYALVRTGKEKDAIRILKRSRKMSQHDALLEVARIRRKCGML